MKRAGGIIAIASGVLILAAVVFGLLLAFSGGFDSSEAAFLGLFVLAAGTFALLTIVLGVGILRSSSYVPGVLLMALSILGVVLTFRPGALILLVVLPFLGGFLGALGNNQRRMVEK